MEHALFVITRLMVFFAAVGVVAVLVAFLFGVAMGADDRDTDVRPTNW